MNIRNPEDVLAGGFFTLIGAGVVAIASQYRVGVAAQMGPGYFPLVLGVCLALLGLFILGTAFFTTREAAIPSSTRALLMITVSIFLFAVLLPRAGMVATIFLVSVFSSFAKPKPALFRTLACALCLSAACYVIFVLGLDLRIPIWPRL